MAQNPSTGGGAIKPNWRSRFFRRLFRVSAAFFVAACVIFLAWEIAFHGYIEKNVLYSLDNEMALTLPPGREIDKPYSSCCMPIESLRNKKRTFHVKVDDQRRRVVEGNDPSGTRILMVGDSNLLGQSLAQGETIADDLARLAAQAGNRVWISNYSISGNTSLLALLHARRVIGREHPQAVIVSACFNDAKIAPKYVADLYRWGVWELTEKKLNRYIFMGDFAALLAIGAIRDYGGNHVRSPMIPLEEYRSNLEALIRLARENSAVAVFIATDTQAKKEGEADPYADSIRSAVESADNAGMIHLADLANEAVPVIFSSPHFEAERMRIRATYNEKWIETGSLYWATSDRGHPNPALAEIVAYELYQQLHRLRPAQFAASPTPDWKSW